MASAVVFKEGSRERHVTQNLWAVLAGASLYLHLRPKPGRMAGLQDHLGKIGPGPEHIN